jgi:hypothetical protein
VPRRTEVKNERRFILFYSVRVCTNLFEYKELALNAPAGQRKQDRARRIDLKSHFSLFYVVTVVS